MSRLFLSLAVLIGAVWPLAAQTGPENGRKQAQAVEVAPGAMQLDGRLDEDVWRTAPSLDDFLQREPNEGSVPGDSMEVRFAYDNEALYVGARMASAAPIVAPMGRRDEVEKSEQLRVSLDPYLDRRTATTFGVTASGVRLDHYYPSDNARDTDSGFDPVWEARTALVDGGWTAELRIPFSQLRFNLNEQGGQVWGLNVQRVVPARNEEVHWALVRRTEQGWPSRFGELRGIGGIRPGRRLELLPYVGGGGRAIGDRDKANPFESQANVEARAGMDAKMGLGPNLTLEATINPDFGQVEADPAEVNLSAFETFFDERRPFFLEGIQLLTGQEESYFYSRRIGAPPGGPAAGDYLDYPSTTTILGAAKLTGRLASGLSVGALGAVTDEESARTFGPIPQFGEIRVAPRTSYGVGRLQQEFGADGSTVALMTTAVHRSLDPGDPLAGLLARNAFTLSGDSAIRFRDADYELRVNSGLTYVDGEAPAIDRIQRSSARYFQRPDATYITYDPSRTSLFGAAGGVELLRRNAEHWVWEASTGFSSPGFETNDVGRLSQTDRLTAEANVVYQETDPGPRLRAYAYRLRTENVWNYDGDLQSAELVPSLDYTWPNFMESEITGTFTFPTQDQTLTRGGPSMSIPRAWNLEVEVEGNDSAATRAEIALSYGRNEDGGWASEAIVGVFLQPSPRWRLSLEPRWERRLDTQQYVTTRGGGPPATYDRRYVFAHVDRTEYSTQIRLNYTFRPDLNLDFYAEPFASSGRYARFGELVAPRGRLMREYGTDGTAMATLPDGSKVVTDGADTFALANRDFRVQSLRSNLVLRWEWRLGSTLYIVWQQDRETEEDFGNRVTPSDMWGSFGARGDHIFAIKTSFWLSLD